MPAENKYELRSPEVQEVLSAPPKTLIFWGNIIIIIILVSGFLFIGNYKIIQKASVPFQLVKNDSAYFAYILIDSSLSTQVMPGQKVLLKLNSPDTVLESRVENILENSKMNGKKLFLIKGTSLTDDFFNSRGQNVDGQAEFHIGKITLLQLFVSKMFKSHVK